MHQESPDQPLPAHPITVARQLLTQNQLDFGDSTDFEDAWHGFIGSIDDALVTGARGRPVWNLGAYGFLDRSNAPPSVNPSLWRLARLNRLHGLFEVCPRIYQVRGFDIANITFVEGDTGLIVIDPLTFEESAQAALALYQQHRGVRPVRAVIYSHCHLDHYGGVHGVLDEAEVLAGRVPVIAPEGFVDELVAQNILAGVPVLRRSQFQFGTPLSPGVLSHVDSGLGKAMGKGTPGLILPTQHITRSGQRLRLDGVEIEFQLAPGHRAEMSFFFPELRALNTAENACHTLHNLCPLRGARTRDALAWSRHLDEAIDRYAGQVDVVFAQHHWPVHGGDRVTAFMTEQRDLYRYLHDQTLRLMSHGLTPIEIAEQLLVPSGLEQKWHTRGYYGAVVDNVKAIYASYMGPYDGNPAHLNPLPPTEAGARYIECMGGMEAVLARAKKDYEQGHFRWVAEVMNHAVFADPGHAEARALAANALEQLGYLSESAAWRNSYLLAARELRQGRPSPRPPIGCVQASALARLPLPHVFDQLAIRIKGPAVSHLLLRIDWLLVDEAVEHRLTLSHGALSHRPGRHGAAAMATVRCSRAALKDALASTNGFTTALGNGSIEVHGAVNQVRSLFQGLDCFDPAFAVVEP